jgi:regulatory protein YycH of two-component signal transduction system YycFG
MIEKTKSYLLVILVIFSLIQSYELTFGRPAFKTLGTSKVVQTTWQGEAKSIKDVLLPSYFVAHFGSDRHIVVRPQQTGYQELNKKLQTRALSDLRTQSYSSINWNELRSSRKGIEIQFPTNMPFTLLRVAYPLSSEAIPYLDNVSSLWLSLSEKEDHVVAYFISKSHKSVYQAMKVEWSVKEVEQLLGQAQSDHQKMNDVWINNTTYLPEASIFIPKLTFRYSDVSPSQLQSSLFVDPTAGRKLLSQRGVQIYTDGKRGIKIDQDYKWLIYNDPITVPETSTNLVSNAQMALKFINLHGGLSGSYVLSSIPEDMNLTFGLTQYMNGYPLFGPNQYVTHSIGISIKNALVTSYERSTVVIDSSKPLSSELTELPGQKKLFATNHTYLETTAIDAIYPVYTVSYGENHVVTLMPRWLAKQTNGQMQLLN